MSLLTQDKIKAACESLYVGAPNYPNSKVLSAPRLCMSNAIQGRNKVRCALVLKDLSFSIAHKIHTSSHYRILLNEQIYWTDAVYRENRGDYRFAGGRPVTQNNVKWLQILFSY